MSEEFAGLVVDDSDVEVFDDEDDAGVFVGSSDADVVEFAVVRRVTLPASPTMSRRIR